MDFYRLFLNDVPSERVLMSRNIRPLSVTTRSSAEMRKNAGNRNRKRNFADNVEILRRSLAEQSKGEGSMLILFKIHLNDPLAGQRT